MGRSVDIMNLPSNRNLLLHKKPITTINNFKPPHFHWTILFDFMFTLWIIHDIIYTISTCKLHNLLLCKKLLKYLHLLLLLIIILLVSKNLRLLNRFKKYFDLEISSFQEQIVISMKLLENIWESTMIMLQ